MISPDWCRMMAAYNSEMNRRLYAAADGLDASTRQADGGAADRLIALHVVTLHLRRRGAVVHGVDLLDALGGVEPGAEHEPAVVVGPAAARGAPPPPRTTGGRAWRWPPATAPGLTAVA